MNSHHIIAKAELPQMASTTISLFQPGLTNLPFGSCLQKQRGVVLFFTLVALLAMSLAAVALIRSVDTGSMIVGNLAFKQAATSSADSGIAESMTWMAGVTADSKALGLKIQTNPLHPLNNTSLSDRPGYYAAFDPLFDVTDPDNWDSNSVLIPGDESGHEVRYIVQRLCRDTGIELSKNDCLLGAVVSATGPVAIVPAPEYCPKALDCADEGSPAQMRITVRSRGPNKSVSYVQGFVY